MDAYGVEVFNNKNTSFEFVVSCFPLDWIESRKEE